MSAGGAGEGGFSLIEALAALTVASMALLALLSLQEQLASGQRRHAQALKLVALQRNALALTSDLNPSERPVGEIAMTGGRRLRWTSAPLSPSRPQQPLDQSASRWRLQLWRVQVVILDRGGTPLGRLSFDRVGWTPAAQGR